MHTKQALAVMLGVLFLAPLQLAFSPVLAFGAFGSASMETESALTSALVAAPFVGFVVAAFALYVWAVALFVGHAARSPRARPHRAAWIAFVVLTGPLGPLVYWCAIVDREVLQPA